MEILQERKKSTPSSDGQGRSSFFASVPIQAKLTVNTPGDQYEQEADAVSEQVVNQLSESSTNSDPSKTPSSTRNDPTSLSISGVSNFLNVRKPLPSNVTPVQAKCGSCEEEESTLMAKHGLSFQPTISDETTRQLSSSKGSGDPLLKNTKSEMEQGFGVDFSKVRIHTDPGAETMSKNLGAQAFTHGSDIYFNSGKFETQSRGGKKLLAHELTHVVQQKRQKSNTIMRVVDDANVEAEFNKWADDNKKTKDRNHADFPWAVWDFIRPQIVDDTMSPLPKPAASDKAALQKWNDNFTKAEFISRWLFTLKSTTKDDKIKSEADSKAYYILDSLAKAGFVSKAIAQSGYLEDSNRTLVYNTILSKPSTVSATEFETIVNFQCKGAADPSSVPIVQIFTDGNDSTLKHLTADQTKAIFKVLITKFGSHDTIIEAIAEVLMFNPSVRNSVSDALMDSTIGTPEVMFKVLKHPYFIEPEYGASVLSNVMPKDLTTEEYEEKRMKDDMPWVYIYKQKYYVQFLIDLAKSQSITINKPSSMNFAGLKIWLESNTEKISDAAGKKYPTDPKGIFEIYRNIADIFFYHIPHDRDAVPDLEGKISHLKQGQPSKKRFEADCDVFATYAMRLFFNAGFDPIGYVAIVPEGVDASRAAHVAALIRKNGDYSVINNKGILNTGITESTADSKKTDALKKLRKLSFEDAYGIPRPTEMKIYYSDAEAKGKMPKLFKNQDSSLERTDL